MPATRLELMGPFTTIERDALVANAVMPPYTVILNTTNGQLEYWDTPFWKGVLGANISVTGNALVAGTLGVSGATSLAALVAGPTNVTGSLTVDVDALILGGLGVSGATALSSLTTTGHVQVNTTLTTVGNVIVGGTLGVTGATSLAALTASGAVQVNSTLTTTGNALVGGTLGVSGATSLGNTVTAAGAVEFNLTLTVAGHLEASSTFGAGSAIVDGTLAVNGLISANGSIRLATDTTLQNNSGIGIIKLSNTADALRVLYPTLIGADADPAAGVTLEVRGKELITTEIEIDGALNHDGANVGFRGAAPVAMSAAYTPTNVTTDRSWDCNATSIDEVADVLATVVADLQLQGLLG